MNIDMLQLSKEKNLSFEFRLFQDDLSGYGDIYEGRIGADGVLIKGNIKQESADTFLLTFTLTGSIVYPCARCLDPVPVDTSFAFEDTIDVEPGAKTIALIPYVEECLFINEPFKVLCDENCKGLCPNCGANLNHETCSCSADAEIDPRLEALKKLL